jgi:transposase-like protein
MNKLKRHQRYDNEFKRNAAALYVDGKQTLSELSQNLGVPESTLYTWIAEYRKSGDKSFEPKQLSAQEKEMIRLKRQLADVTMERDILKKAIAIFSSKK